MYITSHSVSNSENTMARKTKIFSKVYIDRFKDQNLSHSHSLKHLAFNSFSIMVFIFSLVLILGLILGQKKICLVYLVKLQTLLYSIKYVFEHNLQFI